MGEEGREVQDTTYCSNRSYLLSKWVRKGEKYKQRWIVKIDLIYHELPGIRWVISSVPTIQHISVQVYNYGWGRARRYRSNELVKTVILCYLTKYLSRIEMTFCITHASLISAANILTLVRWYHSSSSNKSHTYFSQSRMMFLSPIHRYLCRIIYASLHAWPLYNS